MITGFATVSAVSGDFVLISDTGDSGNLKNVDVVDFLDITFPINFPEQASTPAVSPQTINFSGSTRHAQRYVLTENTTFTFTGMTGATTEYIDLLLVQNNPGSHTINLGAIENAAQVEAGLNLGIDEETSIVIKSHYGKIYAYLQGANIFPINFPEKIATDAFLEQPISFAGTDRHSQKFTLLEDTTTLTFIDETLGTTEYIDLFLVQNPAGNRKILLPENTINKTQVEQGINLNSNGETYILLKYAYGQFSAFLQGGSFTFTTTTFTGSDVSDNNIVIYGFTDTVGGTLTIQSADIAVPGRIFIIKDQGGNASTNNIFVNTESSETIDNAVSASINANFGSITLYSDGSNLFTW